MKRLLTALSAASLLVVVSGASFAQDASSEITPPSKGVAEVSLALNAQLQSPSSTDLQLSYAPYLNRNIQVGGSVAYAHQSGSGGYSSYTQWAVGAKAIYNFVKAEGPVSRTIPYAGVGLTFAKAKGGGYSESSTVWSVGGGVKQFITPNVALFGQLYFNKADKEVFRDGKKDELRFTVGLSTYLGAAE